MTNTSTVRYWLNKQSRNLEEGESSAPKLAIAICKKSKNYELPD